MGRVAILVDGALSHTHQAQTPHRRQSMKTWKTVLFERCNEAFIALANKKEDEDFYSKGKMQGKFEGLFELIGELDLEAEYSDWKTKHGYQD